MRKLLIICLALFLTAVPTAVFAQDDGAAPASPFVGCGDLAADECTALISAWQNMEELTSGSSETSLDVDVANVPGLPMEAINLQVDRSAQFNVDQALIDKFSGLQDMDPADLAAMVEDPDQYAELVADLIAGLDTQQTLRFTFSDELAAEISDAAGLSLPSEVQLNLILKDGTLYVFLDDIIGLVPNIPPLLRGWVGLDVQPLIDLALQEAGSSDLPVGPEVLRFVPPGVGMAGVGLAMQRPLNQTANVTAAEDGSGYVADMNFVGYFASPEFRDLLAFVVEQAGIAEDEPLSADDIDQLANVVTLLGPVIAEDLNYVIDMKSDGEYITETDGALEWDTAELLDLIATLQDSDEPLLESAPYVNIQGTTAYAAHNSGEEVQAPQGAFVLPVQMLMGILGGL
jgi:hypothetical protein